MAPFRGLNLEVLGANDTPCEEFQTADNIERSTGITNHYLLKLPLGRFTFKLTITNDFQWYNENALRLSMDFDNQHTDIEVLVLRRPMSSIKPQQLHFLECPAGRRVHIGGFTRIGNDYEQRVTFETRPLDGYGSATAIQKQGTICVMIERCSLQFSKIDLTPAPASINTDVKAAKQHLLEGAGIRSYVKLSGLTTHQIQRRMFKVATSASRLSVAVFVFHYRVPEEFAKIKRLDGANQVQEIRSGVYRISSIAPETKQEEDDDAVSMLQSTSRRTPEPRLPIADSITVTEAGGGDIDDDALAISRLLDDIDAKEAEVSKLSEKHDEARTSHTAELNTLVARQDNLQRQFDQDKATFKAEKAKLEAGIGDMNKRIADARRYQAGKLSELHSELETKGLTLQDLEAENNRLGEKVERGKRSLEAISARKRKRTSE